MAPLRAVGPAAPGGGGTYRRGLLVALAALAPALVATPAAGEGDAYARLLATHIRPGVISGIRLHAVDYRAVKADPDYAGALADLAAARPDARPEPDQFAFWVNAYNLLAIKAVLDQYPVSSIRDGGSLFQSIWKKPVGTVDGREYSLDDIEHGILRKRFREPRVHFAIVCASLSCPDLRREPYRGATLGAQLDAAARGFLENPTKGLVPGTDGRSARVSSIFKWFRDDFGGAGGVAAFIKARAGPAVAARLTGLTDAGLTYLDYDWSLNDTVRAR